MKQIKRVLYSMILKYLPGGAKAKTDFIRKHHLFGSIGENCFIQKWKLPLYSNLIHIHNNVKIASNVGFVTHDIIHTMLNGRSGGGQIRRENRVYRNNGQCVYWIWNANFV